MGKHSAAAAHAPLLAHSQRDDDLDDPAAPALVDQLRTARRRAKEMNPDRPGGGGHPMRAAAALSRWDRQIGGARAMLATVLAGLRGLFQRLSHHAALATLTLVGAIGVALAPMLLQSGSPAAGHPSDPSPTTPVHPMRQPTADGANRLGAAAAAALAGRQPIPSSPPTRPTSHPVSAEGRGDTPADNTTTAPGDGARDDAAAPDTDAPDGAAMVRADTGDRPSDATANVSRQCRRHGRHRHC